MKKECVAHLGDAVGLITEAIKDLIKARDSADSFIHKKQLESFINELMWVMSRDHDTRGLVPFLNQHIGRIEP